MGLILEYTEGQTPLDEEEKEGLLVSSITNRGELDEFEQQNIVKAIEWTLVRKFSAEKLLTEKFVCDLHRKMFGEVWKWAGSFRKSDKNLGIDWKQVSIALRQINDDCLHWIKHKTHSDDEIPIRYKHRLVSIHCFPNGNGRHSRLMADVLISHVFGKPVFTWSRGGTHKKDPRSEYLKAIKIADKGNIKPLLLFAKS